MKHHIKHHFFVQERQGRIMIDITSFGEYLIDFTPAGVSQQGNTLFERNPGGAPANVAVCVSRLGGKAAFIGKVGNDMFGQFLHSVLVENGVEASGLKFSNTVKTTLAFVELDEKGERSFSFYRDPGADTTIHPEEINYDLIKTSKVFHFGSLSMTAEPARSATFSAIRCAKQSGCMVSYDPNLRPPLWESMDMAKQQIKSVMSFVDIIKISEEEMEFITGEKDLDKGTGIIYNDYGIKLILVTMGSRGSFYRFGDITGARDTYKSMKAVDTTGAGDAFLGGFLYFMLSCGVTNLKELDAGKLENSIAFANATASLCVTEKGAIPAMPSLSSVLELIKKGF